VVEAASLDHNTFQKCTKNVKSRFKTTANVKTSGTAILSQSAQRQHSNKFPNKKAFRRTWYSPTGLTSSDRFKLPMLITATTENQSVAAASRARQAKNQAGRYCLGKKISRD
jgi:hypothetical protein